MIDPKIIRQKPDAVRAMLKARCVEYDFEKLVESDTKWRDITDKVDVLRRTKNDAGRAISQIKKSGKDPSEALAQLKKVTAELESLELKQQGAYTKYQLMASTIPNMIHESVPVGPDEKSNTKISSWGHTTSSNVDHISIMEAKDILDIGRAAKVAGARFYYLRGDAVLLNHALVSFALDFAIAHGYTPIHPPYMINRESMEGSVIAKDFEDSIYKIDGQDLYMIGTSEHSMASMHKDEIIEGATLPIRYIGTSPCFRKEAGAHGRDQKGIFRVHQFDKVEQFSFTKPEDSWAEHERMLNIAQEFYRKLEIPYQTLVLSSGDMGKVAAKTYDIEGWMAGQGAYREMVSCSNCLDYQARRLQIRFRDSTDAQTQYLHTLNSTLVATTRTLVAIVEQNSDNDKIRVPKVLQKYINKDEI